MKKHPMYAPQLGTLAAGNKAYLLLCITTLVFSISIFDELLSWILLLVFCSTVMRIALFLDLQKHLPTRRTLNLLALLSSIGLAYSSFELGLLLGMVNLLVLACTLKLIQLRNRRDFYQLAAALLFLLACGFIFEQSIGFALFYGSLVLAVLLALALFNRPAVKTRVQMSALAVQCLLAAPIGLLLFLLLPKLPPLWQTPLAKGSQTGLSEELTPGDIAQLSQSSDLVFRATFKGAIPTAYERYWRAIVMEDFDGKTWRLSPQRTQTRRFSMQVGQEYKPVLNGVPYDYQVIAEPSAQNWLYGLDIALAKNGPSKQGIWQGYQYQLYSFRPLLSQKVYEVESYPQALALQRLTNIDTKLNLHLPNQGNPLTAQWVKEMQSEYTNEQSLINGFMAHFGSGEYRYTLRPAKMYSDPVDQLLFDKKAGFCSHYASALAYSLRLAGIPARVVAGYQGGELSNPQEQSSDNFLSVYQYDAHAWVEAYTASTGWQRLDPTSVVAPDRLQYGLQEAMREEGSFLADSPFSLAKLSNIAWLNNIRLMLADIDYNWSRWVLGFDSQQQRDLFKKIIGELNPQRLALLGLAVVVIICLILSLLYLPLWWRARLSPAQYHYQQALIGLSKLGIQRQPWQGPADFAAMVDEQAPKQVAKHFKHLTSLYTQHLYCASSPTAKVKIKDLALSAKALQQALKQYRSTLART